MALSRFNLHNLTHTQRSLLKTHTWSSQLLHHRFSSATTHHHEKPDTKQVSISDDDSTNKPKLFSAHRRSLWSKNNHRNSLSGFGTAMATMNRLLNNLSPWHLIRRLKQKDESYDIKYQMPGLSKDDVKISVEDGILFIRGEHKDSGEDENWWGASYSYYNTSLRLPEDAKVEEITAEMKNGVLHLIIPKDETKKKDIIKEVQVG